MTDFGRDFYYSFKRFTVTLTEPDGGATDIRTWLPFTRLDALINRNWFESVTVVYK